MSKHSPRIYELEVSLTGGPVTEAFVQANPAVSRTIEVRGDQTLEQLHNAIFDAFDREEEHLYEFQLGGRRPMDRKARQYVMPMADDGESAGLVTRTTLDDLGLKKRQVLRYWFDFGDDWWHEIRVTDVREESGGGEYPRVTARTGQSPPQYGDWDDEEYDEDAEDDKPD